MKKNISRIAALLAAAALVFGAVGCSSDDDEDNTPGSGTPVAVTGVTVDQKTVSLTVGDTATVTATVTPSNATDNTVTWKSDNESVATVKDGVITAVTAGTATVKVTAGGQSATVAVTVKAKDAGGEGGGETTGLENTYWTYSFEETEDGITTTITDAAYLYFKDATSGTAYSVVISSSDNEAETAAYNEGSPFTYTKSGNAVSVTTTDAEEGVVTTETVSGTLSSDGNSITFTVTDEETKETETMEFKKVSAAPSVPVIKTTGGDTPVTPSTGVTTWNFTASNAWKIDSSEADQGGKTLAPTSGSSATMSINGVWKYYTGTDAGSSAIQSKASSDVTVEVLGSSWKPSSSSSRYLSVTLTEAGTITVSGRGAGNADAKRYLGILDSAAATVYDKAGNLGSDTVKLTAKVEAGTYLIASNGSRIFSVTVE